MTGQLYCGTSGYSYPTWKPGFYPAKLPAKQFLAHYATRLPAVESNYTFRSLPSPATIEQWIRNTPDGFRFAVKAHQRMTHFKPEEAVDFAGLFFKALEPLGQSGRLGPVLLQFSPRTPVNPALLSDLLSAAPAGVRMAAEFRHESWFTDEIFRLLESRAAALCLAESERLETPPVLTTDFVYARLRKTSYTPAALGQIQQQAAGFRNTGRDVFLFFMHQDDPAGTAYAETIQQAG
ncbi:MAG TPA: DUF72 domain-containing protein [Bryobacteraceae bacterium]|nr:DUF72 domain-containing protein [Bryobacteraceae bacterium]